jgi:transcriptional regulator with XRE-family HTH domain
MERNLAVGPGESLAERRFNAGLSADELGAACGVAGNTIRRIEDGATRPSPRVAKKLADYFSVKPTELFPPDAKAEAPAA